MAYSTEFQDKLPNKTLDDFQTDVINGEIKQKVVWIYYSLCKGNFQDVLHFLSKESDKMQHRYLNQTMSGLCKGNLWEGTVLHILLMWNSYSGDTMVNPFSNKISMSPFDAYKALRKMGAELTVNNLPWEDTPSWWYAPVDTIDATKYGKRDVKMFQPLYNRITEWEITTKTKAKFYDWTDPTCWNDPTRYWEWESDPCRCGLYCVHQDPLADCDT